MSCNWEEQERVRREGILAGTLKLDEGEKLATQELKILMERLAGGD